jgi:hypothetical protein
MTTQFGMVWSAEDCTKVLALADEGKSLEEIGSMMGRKPGSIRTKLKRLRPGTSLKLVAWTEADKKQLISLRDGAKLGWTEIGERLGRPSGTVYDKYKYLKHASSIGPRIQSTNGMLIPEEVLAERNRRQAAPITISAYVLGDPRPGFSALDRRPAPVTPGYLLGLRDLETV